MFALFICEISKLVIIYFSKTSGIAISIINTDNNNNNNNGNNITPLSKIVQRDEIVGKTQFLMKEDVNAEHKNNIYPKDNTNFLTTTHPLNQTKNSTDPNNKTTSGDDNASLEEQLKDDQLALKRMITILSLVGGLGGLAIVATIIIYARMRSRKVKHEKELTMYRNSNNDHGDNNNNSNNNNNNNQNNDDDDDNGGYRENEYQSNIDMNMNNNHLQSTNNNNHSLNEISPSSSNDIPVQRRLFTEEDHLTPQPSAPPTSSSSATTNTTIISTAPILPTLCMDQNQNQQQLFMQSQQSSAPTPSAPSAKELAIQRENAASNTILYQSSSSTHHQQHSFLHDDDFENNYYHQTQPINDSILTPDIPPPAYTASPIYDRSTLPPEITNTPLHSSSTTSLPLPTNIQTHSHHSSIS
ncbi:unnamed protein product [Cunninghamella blakesleeana]